MGYLAQKVRGVRYEHHAHATTTMAVRAAQEASFGLQQAIEHST